MQMQFHLRISPVAGHVATPATVATAAVLGLNEAPLTYLRFPPGAEERLAQMAIDEADGSTVIAVQRLESACTVIRRWWVEDNIYGDQQPGADQNDWPPPAAGAQR